MYGVDRRFDAQAPSDRFLNMPQPVSAEHPADELHAADAASSLWVEICRGRTQFPRRPIAGSRFLIGAGSNCHLQLGGEGMPFLHSLIAVESGAVIVEAFVPHPELQVNGEPVRTAELRDGDRVSLGAFEFILHGRPVADSAQADESETSVRLERSDDESVEDLQTLSASELVARIEAAEADLERYDELRQPGAAALLAAVRNAGPAASERRPASEAAAESHGTREAELLDELSGISQELEQRLSLLREREREQVARAEALLGAQDRLAEQLRLAAQSLSQEQARIRASA